MLSANCHTLGRILSQDCKELSLDSLPPDQWGTLLKEAQAQGLGPMLYWVLSKANLLQTIPGGIRDALRRLYARAWMQNQRNLEQLELLANRFQGADIPVVALKGICFALTVYPDIGLRPMGDLDLLVPAHRLEEAVSIAHALGYQETMPDASLGLRDLLNHEVYLEKKSDLPVTLELHHSLVADKTYSYAVPMEWFWEAVEPLRVVPSEKRFPNVLMLSPAAQILYAAGHAMLQHGGQKAPLRWFYDLDRLIRHYEGQFDWGVLLSQAAQFKWGSALAAALLQTSECFETPIPADIYSRLSESDDRHEKLVALKQKPPATHTLEEWQKFVSLNWHGRLRFVLALAFPSPSYMRWRYRQKTSWWLPAWYLYRWWGIFTDLIRTLAHLLRTSLPVA